MGPPIRKKRVSTPYRLRLVASISYPRVSDHPRRPEALKIGRAEAQEVGVDFGVVLPEDPRLRGGEPRVVHQLLAADDAQQGVPLPVPGVGCPARIDAAVVVGPARVAGIDPTRRARAQRVVVADPLVRPTGHQPTSVADS